MSEEKKCPGLGEAAIQYLAGLSSLDKENVQHEVYKFVRWYGWDKSFDVLAAHDVARYAEQLSLSDTGYTKKFELIKAFLTHAKKESWSRTNLAPHLKAKKAKTGPRIAAKPVKHEVITLSQEKYDELQAELTELKEKRHVLIDEIRKAAADKDFRENAPLAAAREQRGYVEGRIKELEETFKFATILEEKRGPSLKSGIGDSIILIDLASGSEMCYKIVDPREVDPARGKISMASPLGKALIGRRSGDNVVVSAPAGKLKYQIKSIER
jgi:transcription elongation factor GreA